ncbi:MULTISPECIES: LuxR C-terminal-related transcriptional regulator [Symbiopectobacterium]|nr:MULTISPECIES: LuxR C-terminal-related transcriptional regulator [Symbiopectobacterium]
MLYWTSVGKTYQEMGIILGIKVRTVKFHMLNIVKKWVSPMPGMLCVLA